VLEVAAMPLLLFALASTCSPGGATTLATASGAQFGFRGSLPFICGSAFGVSSLCAAAGAGLSGLMLSSPSLGFLMKVAGSAYLLILAWGIANSGAPGARTSLATPIGFLGGAALAWANPKAWAMSAGAATSFAAPAADPLQISLWFAAVFGMFGLLSMSVWSVAGVLLARALRTDRQWQAVNITLAIALTASILPTWLA
jgi:threonine/homoserine/homoserine lactone efflux protein